MSADIVYRIAITPEFARDQRRFADEPAVLADLLDTLAELGRQPFHNPKLETHKVKRAQPGVMTSYVGNRQHRIIWFRAEHTLMLLLFDRHDEAYRRAERVKVSIDSGNAVKIEIAEPAARSPEPRRPSHAKASGPAPFDAWDDGILVEAGFVQHEINVLRDLRSDDDVLGAQRYLSPDAFERALEVLTATSADEVRALGEKPEEEMEPDPQVATVIVASADDDSEPSVVGIERSDIAAVFSRPIEDWMLFLHPDQRHLVTRPFNGPARVTGGAGTGKTVVGVHRAARLAAEGRRVLFTTYIGTLPRVLERLYERLAPETADRLHFAGVHAHALHLVRGMKVRVDGSQSDAAFDEAWRKTVTKGSALRELGLGKGYFKDEISWIVKGRGLTLDRSSDYFEAPRSGRGTPFPIEVREQVWELYAAYEKRLRARNVVDFDDVLLMARDLVRAGGDPDGFDCVIVDEAQDLTRVGLELVGAIAGNSSDGLLLLGDGQQALYPGGHSLGSVGIDVRGRAAVLRVNYRNTAEILRVADGVVAGRPFDDGDPELNLADPLERLDVTRTGELPVVRRFDSVDDHDAELTIAIQDLAARSDTGLGDIAVLVPTNQLVRTYAARIEDLGLPCQSLSDYDGTPTPQVKVGTFKRAKGLEFKHVLLPRLEPGVLKDAPFGGEDVATHVERLDRTRRELFVAITRARDSVWVGHAGEASALIGS